MGDVGSKVITNPTNSAVACWNIGRGWEPMIGGASYCTLPLEVCVESCSKWFEIDGQNKLRGGKAMGDLLNRFETLVREASEKS